MISQLHIKNFKSIVDLTLDLGRVNLFIGENGCGKSNILEAVAFATSANEGIVNTTVLYSKGVRVTDAIYYHNGFSDVQLDNIEISLLDDNYWWHNFFNLENYEVWRNSNVGTEFVNFLVKAVPYFDDPSGAIRLKKDEFGGYEFAVNFEKLKTSTSNKEKSKLIEDYNDVIQYIERSRSEFMSKYMIYSPENSSLRKFEEEGQVKPLGSRGEGLFGLLKSLSKDNGSLQYVKEYLEAIDWFEDFSIPNDLMSNEYKIAIKDRFINSDLMQLDQRSANEGFLFLLFYIVLFSSKKTPQFFAVDNIEASFNPKLCAKLINMLVELSKKNEKQVLMTTHNPATLDGLDLNDPEQRLFVVRRNIDGHTIATRITEKPKISTPMKLSEMWTKGLLGGLPNNF